MLASVDAGGVVPHDIMAIANEAVAKERRIVFIGKDLLRTNLSVGSTLSASWRILG